MATSPGIAAAQTTVNDRSKSLKIYGGLILFMIAVKIVFLLFPTRFPVAEQASAFYWRTIAVVALIGIIGIFLGRRSGFPDMWNDRIATRAGVLLPIVIGLVYGAITVAKDLADPSAVHLKLPLGIFFFSYGALLLEIMLRQFAIPTLVWLISNMLLRGRAQQWVFWIAAIVAALYEPLPIIQQEIHAARAIAIPAIVVNWAFQPLFLANVLAGWLFRRYGLLSPLLMRLAFYLVWHILYGGLISVAPK
jgi:hypothetical protein